MRRALHLLIVLFALNFLFACQSETKSEAEAEVLEVQPLPTTEDSSGLKITSSAFIHEGMIPARYTCDGDDIAPELSWRHVPDSVVSFAMICDDPDAPNGDWVHWVLYNIPAEDSCLSLEKREQVPRHLDGLNSWGNTGYGGPCPPNGTHRYYFKLYALDTVLDLGEGATKDELLRAMEGHIMVSGQIMGRYERQH